ncbi:MAG: PadR family transcriptional regulator [Actinomycetota bacterium]|nr:PadR family transcriptional regulator [Actinomycetota bacterium]
MYTTLDRLERDGLVEAAAADEGQRAWRLTGRGREELGEWWWAVPGEEPPPRDELVLKVLLAVAGDRDHALEVIGPPAGRAARAPRPAASAGPGPASRRR